MMSSRYTVKLLPRYVFLSEINIWFGWENKADSSLCCRQGFYSQKKVGIEPKREDNMPSWVGRICPAWQPLSRGTSFSPAFKVELKYIDFCGSCKYWCLDWNIDSWALTVPSSVSPGAAMSLIHSSDFETCVQKNFGTFSLDMSMLLFLLF